MSDGKIVIDVTLDANQVKSDAKVIEQILKSIGHNTGQGMASSFNHSASQMTHQAQQTAHNIQQQLSHPINLNVHLNSSSATHNASNTFNQINHMAQTTSGHLSHLKEVFEGTFAANMVEGGLEFVKTGIEKLVEAGMEYNAQQDKMKAVWKTLTGSQGQGDYMVNMINGFQKATGYDTEVLNEIEQKIYHIKGSADEAKKDTQAFTTLGDAMGVSGPRLAQVAEYFSHMMASGKATATDLHVLTDAFPAFGEALQETVGKNMGAIRKMTKKGTLPASVLEETLLHMQNKYKDATANMMSTSEGLVRTMKSNWGRLAGDFTKPLFDMKKSGFKDLSEWMGSGAADKMFTGMGQAIAGIAGKITDFIVVIYKNRDTIFAFGKALLMVVGAIKLFSIIKTAVGAIQELGTVIFTFIKSLGSLTEITALLGGPIGWIALAITAVGVACVYAWNHSKQFQDFVKGIGTDISKAWDWVKQFGTAIKDLFSGNLTGTVKATSIMEKLGISSKTQVEISKFVGIVKQDFDSIAGAVTGAIKWIGQFGTAIKDMFGGIDGVTKGTSIMEKLGLSPAQQKLVSQVVGAIEKDFQDFKDTIKKVWDDIQSATKQVWSVISGSIKQGIDYAMGYIEPALKALQKYWDSIWPELAPAVTNLWNIMKTIVEVDLLPLWIGIQIALGVLKNSWKDIWATICSLVKTAFDIIVAAIQYGWDIASGIFKVIIDLLSGNFPKAWKDMKETVVKTLGDLWKNVQKISGDIGDAFKNLGKTIADGLIGGLAAGVNAVSGGINWILDKVNAPKGARIPTWNPPHYAQGTGGHQGGLAVVGDGKKKELIQLPTGHMFLSPATDTLMNLPKGTQVLDGNNTEKMMGMGLIPKYANGIGGAWDWIKSKASSAWGNISDIGKNIWSYASDPSKLLSTVVGKFTNLNKFLNPELGLAEGTIGTATKDAVSWIQSFFGFGGSSGGPPAGNVPGTVQQWLQTAMGMTNTPMQFLGALEQIAMHESGGNPHAINLWDSNAKAGHPSKGLMQTIDGTFNQYAVQGLGDIWNPVANAVAAIRYMNAAYGSIGNVPGVRSLSRGGGYVGYATGTTNSVSGQVVVGENEPELIQTKDGRTVLATHATSFNDFMEGSTVTPLSKIPHYANGIIAKAKSVLNKVGNPSLTSPLVVATANGSGKQQVIEIDMKPITVNSVLDGVIISQTVTDVQNLNSVRNNRLRGEI